MLKKELYKKTERLGESTYEWLVTEKLDGSNLCFFNWCGNTYIALRKHIITLDDLVDDPEHAGADKLYKGLEGWIKEHWADLDAQLLPGAAICGEWLGMGKLKYPGSMPRFNMFAKARVDEDALYFTDLELTRFDYDPENFHYVFRDDKIPGYVGVVPVVGRLNHDPSVMYLDMMYKNYLNEVGRSVEGFVITQKEVPGRRCKYVRMKNGRLEPHVTAEEMAARREAGLKRKAEQQTKERA